MSSATNSQAECRLITPGTTCREQKSSEPPINTPPKTNMEPENGGPLEKEIPIGNHHFQVPC